jgi:glycosyltransferase involved in cell wall biosynthesis
LLIPTLEIGGSERNIVMLGEVLAEAGCEVEIWLTSADRRGVATRLPIVPVGNGHGLRGFAIASRVWRIRKHIERYQPDCLISFLESSNIPAILAGSSKRVATIVSVRGNPERFNWFYRLMAFFLYRHARRVVLPSREVAAVFGRRYGLHNTVCIPNVQVSRCETTVPLAEKMAGPLVAIGRLVPGKRFADVIAVAGKLAAAKPLVIIGDGPERAVLERLAVQTPNAVRFTGALPHKDAQAIVCRASAVISMSVSECWPNVVAEALVAGTPVIARDCDYGPREMITDGRNGFLINTPEDIAARPEIGAALTHIESYAALCQSARNSGAGWTRERVGALWLAQISGARA